MEIKYSGLKCDTENCGYRDKTVEGRFGISLEKIIKEIENGKL